MVLQIRGQRYSVTAAANARKSTPGDDPVKGIVGARSSGRVYVVVSVARGMYG